MEKHGMRWSVRPFPAQTTLLSGGDTPLTSHPSEVRPCCDPGFPGLLISPRTRILEDFGGETPPAPGHHRTEEFNPSLLLQAAVSEQHWYHRFDCQFSHP